MRSASVFLRVFSGFSPGGKQSPLLQNGVLKLGSHLHIIDLLRQNQSGLSHPVTRFAAEVIGGNDVSPAILHKTIPNSVSPIIIVASLNPLAERYGLCDHN